MLVRTANAGAPARVMGSGRRRGGSLVAESAAWLLTRMAIAYMANHGYR
jgi:hypothetical protein